MNRHIEDMTEKALTHVVYTNSPNHIVQSGASGELYRVNQHPNGVSYTCTCAWSDHNPGSECSHILAVRMNQ